MFPCVIKELRLKKNFTQQEIAERIGITRPAYTAYELGKREPDFSTLQALADLFGVSTDQLLGRESSSDPFLSENSLIVASAVDDSISPEGIQEILSFIDYIKSREQKKKTID